MCTDEQHQEKMDELGQLKRLKERDYLPPLDSPIQISATTAYVIDYRGRKHLFMYPMNSASLTLSLEDLGNFALPPDTWTNIGFQAGMRIFAVGQASNVPVFVRATNEVIP